MPIKPFFLRPNVRNNECSTIHSVSNVLKGFFYVTVFKWLQIEWVNLVNITGGATTPSVVVVVLPLGKFWSSTLSFDCFSTGDVGVTLRVTGPIGIG